MTQATLTRNSQPAGSDRVQFRMHPRIFSALGSDLVTNEIVAVIELIKNSYDAFAHNVHLRFLENDDDGRYLEIEDDGCGMSRDIIENVWCVIATPYKERHSYIESTEGRRRVSGEKGLGRLSAARLGPRMRMLTQAADSPCLEVIVDWQKITAGEDLSNSTIICNPYDGTETFNQTGTRIQIFELSEWDGPKCQDLKENLARLISPFAKVSNFRIYATGLGDDGEIEIGFPEFLSEPKYCIKGNADKTGNIKAKYIFTSLADESFRKQKLTLSWRKIAESGSVRERLSSSYQSALCGSFEFEIRAWDIAPEDTQEIEDHFKIKKSQVRKAISTHKGLSVYRDDVLVLPKSENAKDWLGLDLRRVSKVGNRLSTSQIMGYVSITSHNNPGIQDTSDRERLVSRREVVHFEKILKTVVRLLENERNIDRTRRDTRKMFNLFEGVDAGQLLDAAKSLASDDEKFRKTINLIKKHDRELKSTRKTLEERFVYYSRTAAVGTIAHMLIHEIRNRTVAFGAFLKELKERQVATKEKGFEERYNRANRSVDALERLADTFSPLASINIRKRKRISILEKEIEDCLSLQSKEIEKSKIRCSTPQSETRVAVDPGELSTILLNLISNAVFWMDDIPQDKRKITFAFESDETSGRVKVFVEDTGPGISEEDMESVFLPGVTKKPNGIGMGLTVASELVEAHGGRMALKHPNGTQGACFVFDLPLA